MNPRGGADGEGVSPARPRGRTRREQPPAGDLAGTGSQARPVLPVHDVPVGGGPAVAGDRGAPGRRLGPVTRLCAALGTRTRSGLPGRCGTESRREEHVADSSSQSAGGRS